MPETKQQLQQRVKEIIRILRETYPDARCTLDFETPHQLLVAAILAAQCTDEKVNEVTPALFAGYPTVEAFANADQTELEQMVKPTGFFRQKTRSIIESAQDIVNVYGGRVPDTIEDLLTLRGVGRKTANLLLGVVFGKPGIIVDTHVKRVAARLGLTNETDPTKIEFDLREIVPEEDWTHFNHLMVFHGRSICKAPKPLCSICPVQHLCPYGQAQFRALSASGPPTLPTPLTPPPPNC
ncbi:MAG: endonuclease III [Armatimonadota bacterium]|nr:endonuclease III [Armatimonadota bacterium]